MRPVAGLEKALGVRFNEKRGAYHASWTSPDGARASIEYTPEKDGRWMLRIQLDAPAGDRFLAPAIFFPLQSAEGDPDVLDAYFAGCADALSRLSGRVEIDPENILLKGIVKPDGLVDAWTALIMLADFGAGRGALSLVEGPGELSEP